MASSKIDVLHLERFPSEICGCFGQYLSAEQLVRLKMTGAKLLWAKLKSPSGLKSITLGQEIPSFKSWPKFLNELSSLEELSIHSQDTDRSLLSGLDLASIPSGVRKLEFTGGRVRNIPNPFGVCGTWSPCSHFSQLESLDVSVFEAKSCTWMTNLPQTLTKLSLALWDGTVELPSSLIHFEADIVRLSEPSFVYTLPAQLESFQVTFKALGIELLIPFLPPSTRKFTITNKLDLAQNLVIAQLLPLSLTELNMNLRTELLCSEWHLLPPNVSKLSFKAPSSRHTVSQTFDSDGVCREVTSIPFDTLPRSIKRLELVTKCTNIYFCGPPAISDRSYFPPQLAYLSIPDIQLHPETAKLLPSSLTHLEVGNLCEFVCEHLPKCLRTLISSRVWVSPNLFKFLPKSLTKLRLTHLVDGIWFDYNTAINATSIRNIPQYSIHVNSQSTDFNRDSAPLPSTLRYLIIENAIKLGDSFLLDQQPPNLLELNLHLSKHFTDLTVCQLSRHLTSLDLESSHQISGKSFPSLPRCLTFLNLGGSKQIVDSDIQHLPRTLNFLCISNAIDLTASCIPDLPAYLVKLNVEENRKIVSSSFPEFPRSLQLSQVQIPIIFREWYTRGSEVVDNRHKVKPYL